MGVVAPDGGLATSVAVAIAPGWNEWTFPVPMPSCFEFRLVPAAGTEVTFAHLWLNYG